MEQHVRCQPVCGGTYKGRGGGSGVWVRPGTEDRMKVNNRDK